MYIRIGVVSYGALRYVPLELQQFIFSVHFRAAQSLTAAFVRLSLEIYLYSASAAAVVQS